MNNIEKIIYKLLETEPFFANFILGARLIFDIPEVKTAGAMISKTGDIHLVFNTSFLFSKTLDQQIAILKHEVFHLLLDHCGERGGLNVNRMAKNLAMDCAINQHIQNLPDDCVTLQKMQDLTKRTLKPLEAWEYYYEQVKEAAQDQGEPHDHDYMESEDGTPGESKELREAQKQIAVKNAVTKALAASAGKIPNGLSSILDSFNKVGKIPWKQQLRNIIASARTVKTKPTRMKTHRRFDLDQPGRKKIRKLVLGVCLDSSGSVSNESYAMFMAEINNIAKNTTTTYLIHADCEVHKIDVIKDGKVNSELLKERHGNGGTAYGPAIEACVARKCDVIIYAGDLDSSDVPKDPGVPFIWVRVGRQNPPGDFGRVIDLD